MNGVPRPCAKYDLKTGKRLAVYPSAAEAARKNYLSMTGILRCCKGEGKRCGDYAWAFVKRPGAKKCRQSEG